MIWSSFGRKLVALPGVSALLSVIGVIPATSGGTGQSSYTTGDMLYASSASALSKLAIGTNGHFLKVVAGLPSWAAVSGSITAVAAQEFLADDTYTPTTGTAYCLAIVAGAGGAGGNATGNVSAAGGGGGGGTAIGLFPVASLTGQSIDVGTTSGSSSSIGAVISATGGTVGSNDTTDGATTRVAGGAGGIGSGGDLNLQGTEGGRSIKTSTTAATMASGDGGNSMLGGGASHPATANNGAAGGAYGGGGSGGFANNATDRTGGAGAQGVVYIIEFIA